MGLLWRSGPRAFEDDFAAFYLARADSLRKAAYLLCGDWHLAQDLTQITFIKMYRAWSRIEHRDTLDRYSRRVLVRTFLDERRRPWRRESATTPDSLTFDVAGPDDEHRDARMVLRTALTQVPKRQRAVLVLRFWMDLSVEQVAEMLGCSTGTVKSQTSQGLTNLRAVLGDDRHDLFRSSGDRSSGGGIQ